MTRPVALALMTLLASAAGAADPTVPEALIGVWKLESQSADGALPVKLYDAVWLVILEDGQFVVKSPTRVYGGTVAVDAAVSPPAVDFQAKARSDGGKPWTDLAVYQVEDGVLTVAKAQGGKERPASVAPRAGVRVQVFRRAERKAAASAR